MSKTADLQMRWDGGTLKALDRMLGELSARVASQVVARACTKAFKPVLETAKALAPSRTGLLRASLGLKQKKYGGCASSKGKQAVPGYVYNVIGAMKGFKDPETGENPINIAHLVEFGTQGHWIAPKGKRGALAIKRGQGPTRMVAGAVWHPGARAQPFIRPAYDQHKNSVVDTFGAELAIGVDRQIEKLKGTR